MWKRTCKEIYPAVRPGFLEFAKNYGAGAAMNSNAEGGGGEGREGGVGPGLCRSVL